MSPILWRGKWRTLRKRAAIGRWNTPHHSYTSGSKDVPACVRNIVLTIEILIKFLECRVTADLDQSRYTCARQRPTTFTKFRAPSVNGTEMGGSKVSSTPEFFCQQPYNEITFRQLPWTSQRPIFAKFGHDTWIAVATQTLDRNPRKLSIQGSFAPKTPNLEGVKQAHHSEQATGQRRDALHRDTVYSTL